MGKRIRAAAIGMLLGAGVLLAIVTVNLIEAGEALRPRGPYLVGGFAAWPIAVPGLLILIGIGSLGRRDRAAALAGALALAMTGLFLIVQRASGAG